MKDAWGRSLMGAVFLLLVFLMARQAGKMTAASAQANAGREQPLVFLDPGHGGFDPGKIGVQGQLEKDLNLEIAQRLRKYLEAMDVRVMMTRETDTQLGESGEQSKKQADMRARCQMINEATPDLVVSIHQNSYHEPEISGGQVFYYQKSENGKMLARILQERFDYVLGEDNRRQPKANDSYYLLLHVKPVITIVECGFLSSPEEAKKLTDADYQERLAWTLAMGIVQYLNNRP